MKRPRFWTESKKTAAPEPAPAAELPPRTYQFSPRGDLDAFVKIFSGDIGKSKND